jgi:hypothetical protein
LLLTGLPFGIEWGIVEDVLGGYTNGIVSGKQRPQSEFDRLLSTPSQKKQPNNNVDLKKEKKATINQSVDNRGSWINDARASINAQLKRNGECDHCQSKKSHQSTEIETPIEE